MEENKTLFAVDTPDAPKTPAGAPDAPTNVESAMEKAMERNTSTALVPTSPIERMMAQQQEVLQQLNPDFRLDFVNPFTWLKIDKKGKFYYELSGEKFDLGDKINTKLVVGEPVYQLWGPQNTQYDGILVCWSKDHTTSIEGHNCDECPYAGEVNPKTGESLKNDCKIRLALILNVLDDEDPDEYYMLNVPSTGAFAFADYTKLLKKRKKGVRDVVTVLLTEEQQSKSDTSISYNAILFKLGGLA